RRHAMPAGVALPRDRDQVAAIVRACRRHRVPLVARGAGTGTAAAAVPFGGGIVVSFARMNRILQLRPDDRCAVVEPGVVNGDLQQALQPLGLFWPPDPSSFETCTIGGNLACNAGGPRTGEEVRWCGAVWCCAAWPIRPGVRLEAPQDGGTGPGGASALLTHWGLSRG